jgi:hypothetical protein
MMFPLTAGASKRWLQHSFLILLVGALSACGGGSNAGPGSSSSSSSVVSSSSVSSSESSVSSSEASSSSSSSVVSSSSESSSESSSSSVSSSSSSSESSSSSSVADSTPDAFAFAPVTDAVPGELYVSQTVSVTGINVDVPVTIVGGEYSVGNGFTSQSGVISNNGQLTVRAVAPSAPSATVEVIVTVGGVSALYTVRTADDTAADSFTFAAANDVELGSEQVSQAVTVSGISVPVSIAVTGGEYSIDNGAFTSTAGEISNGQSLRLRATASQAASSTVEVTVNVGGITAVYAVRTADDTSVDSFTFAAVNDVEPGSEQVSETVTISGISVPVPVSVTGGEYSINDGGFTSAAGEISNGQRLTLRATASQEQSTTVEVTVTVGDVIAVYAVRTADDVSPDSFSFASVNDVEPGSQHLSQTVTISGISVAVPVSVTGGEYAIDENGFTSEAGQISEGQSLTLRATASQEHSTTADVTVTVGDATATYSVRTLDDVSPDSFSFLAADNVEPGSEQTSEVVTISGISVPVPVSVTGGEYAIDGGEFTSAAGEISNGQTLTVRGTASAQTSTRVDVSVSVGEGDAQYTGVFAITTLTDTTAPEAVITFPPPMSASEPSTLLIRGTAADDYNSVTSVMVSVTSGEGTVTEFAAESTDDFANWTASVTLAPGENVVTVRTEDSKGNPESAAAQVTVHQQAFELAFPDNVEPFGRYLRGLTFDGVHNRLLITSSDNNLSLGYRGAVTTVDLETGRRVLLSADGVPTAGNQLDHAYGIVVDAANNRALVGTAHDISAVSLDSGTASVLSGPSTDDGQPYFRVARSIAIDPANPDIVYFVGENTDNLLRLDLTTGVRTIVSDDTMPETGSLFGSPEGIVIDAQNNRAIVADDTGEALLAVDLETGFRSVVSSTDESSTFYPISVTPGDVGGHVLVADALEGVMRVDLSTGTREVLHPVLGPPDWGVDYFLHYEPGSAFVYWLDVYTEGVYALDLQSRTLVTLSKPVSE